MTSSLPPLPRVVHFRNTVFSHGWCALAPFRLAQDPLILSFPVAMSEKRTVLCQFEAQGRGATAHGTWTSKTSPRKTDSRNVANAVDQVFNVSLDLTPFYQRVRSDARHGWMARARAGRFLRGASLFEDVVKTILTTNCSWSLTETMATRLVDRFGGAAEWHPFPTPARLAEASEEDLRACSLGYRAPYVRECAQRWHRHDPALSELQDPSLPAREAYRILRGWRGIGDYAAGTLLRMMGRHDYLALDSWCRTKFAELHGNGRRVPDAEIDAHYAEWEEWKGLVMWLDLTRHWYHEKFRF